MHRRFHWAVRFAALVIAAAIVGAATWTAMAIHGVTPRTDLSTVLSAVAGGGATPGSIAALVRSNARVNLLFMAHGGAGGDNPDFTDTMLVVSIRPDSGRATLIALPRYLLVEIPASRQGTLSGKLYSAYALGANANQSFLRPEWTTATGPGDLAAAAVERVVGQHIDGWISIDDGAFTALVDAIGGIEVDVPTALDDPKYPASVGDTTIHIHIDAGPQTLDGMRALEYSRSRLTTSEADRARRQEIVLTAIQSRLKAPQLGLASLEALGPLSSGTLTNLTLADLWSLRPVLGRVSQGRTTVLSLFESPLLIRRPIGPGDYVLVPADGTYSAVQSYIASALP